MPNMASYFRAAMKKLQTRSDRQEAADLYRRVLPATLSLQLKEGIAAERGLILQRLVEIHEGISELETRLAAAKAKERALRQPVAAPPLRPRRAMDGSVVAQSPRPPICFINTPDSIKVRHSVHRIELLLKRYQAEKRHRRGELMELNRLEAQVEADVLTCLARLAERFKTPVLLGGLVSRVRMGGSFLGYTDAAGNLLPPEALTAGEPNLPGRMPNRGGPLVIQGGG